MANSWRLCAWLCPNPWEEGRGSFRDKQLDKYDWMHLQKRNGYTALNMNTQSPYFLSSSVSPLDRKQLRKPLYSLVVGPLMSHNALPGVYWGQHRTMEVATKPHGERLKEAWADGRFFFLILKKCESGCGPTGRRRHSASMPPPFPHSFHPSCLILHSQMPSESTARQKQTPKAQWASAGKQKRERKWSHCRCTRPGPPARPTKLHSTRDRERKSHSPSVILPHKRTNCISLSPSSTGQESGWEPGTRLLLSESICLQSHIYISFLISGVTSAPLSSPSAFLFRCFGVCWATSLQIGRYYSKQSDASVLSLCMPERSVHLWEPPQQRLKLRPEWETERERGRCFVLLITDILIAGIECPKSQGTWTLAALI